MYTYIYVYNLRCTRAIKFKIFLTKISHKNLFWYFLIWKVFYLLNSKGTWKPNWSKMRWKQSGQRAAAKTDCRKTWTVSNNWKASVQFRFLSEVHGRLHPQPKCIGQSQSSEAKTKLGKSANGHAGRELVWKYADPVKERSVPIP